MAAVKAVILAGGFGTRLEEETVYRPKPMVEIGGKPILWHIMKIYEAAGVREFVIALGYRGEVIKDYFLDFHALNSDLSVDLATGAVTVHAREKAAWLVHLVDTGSSTMTGGRLLRLRPWLEASGAFHFTYGDGVADIDVNELWRFHQAHGRRATVTTVRPPARFGDLGFAGDRVTGFHEKSDHGRTWINGGFFVLEPEVFDVIEGDESVWEQGPVEHLVAAGELMAFRHHGFWSCMDTIKERRMLEELWSSRTAPWRIWSDGEVDGVAGRR